MRLGLPFRREGLIVTILLVALASSACVRSPEAKSAASMEAGKKLLAQKDPARAILQFRNAAQATPNNADVYYQLGLAYLAAGDVRDGVLALRRALELNPKHTAAQLRFAALETATRDRDLLENAEKRLHEVLATSPVNEDALRILGVTEWGLGNTEDAEQHLRQALDRFPQDLKTALVLVQVNLLQKDFNGAEEILRKFVIENPKSPEPALALGELYILGRREADAVVQFRQVLRIDPRNGPALMDLGGLQFRRGQIQEAERTYKELSGLPDRFYRPMHAIFLFQAGKVDSAIEEFERLIKEDPTDRPARGRLIQAYYNANRKADAEKILDAAIRKNHKDVDALLQQSALYVDAGRYVDAQDNLTLVLGFEPDSSEAHYMLAKVYERTGAALQRQQELDKTIRLKPSFLVGRLELAKAFLETGNPKAARAILKDAPPWQRESLPLLVQLNWANAALKDIPEFRKGVEQALALSKVPEVLLQSAELKFVLLDYPAARKVLEEVLLRSPEDARAMDLMVRIYHAGNQSLGAAIAKMREHANQHPRSAVIQYFLGRMLMENGDRAPARQAFVAAKAADPGFTVADERLAQLDLADGKLDDARKRLSGLLGSNIARDGEISVHMQLAVIEEQAANNQAAIEHCERILQLDPDNLKAMNDLAYLLADYANQPDAALKLAERAKELAPNNPHVSDTLGWVLYRKGLYSVALTHLEYSASRKDAMAVEKCHLALLYFKLGKHEQGQQALKAALKLDPGLAKTKVYEEAITEAKKS